MRNLILSAFVLSVAIQAESPAVTKVLTLINDLNTAKNEKVAGRAKKVNFTLTVNPRPGLNALRVQFYPSNYLATLVTVDFDAVERFRPGTVPMLLRPILNGKRAIQVDVRLQPQVGTATFSVEKASFESVRIPAFVVEQMIAVVASRQAEKFDTTKPVPLPFGLQTIRSDLGKVSGAN